MNKQEIFEKAMEEATKVFGVDPAYFGEEGTEEVDRQLKKMGYSLEWLREEDRVDTKVLEGWLGGHYDDLSLHDTKKDAERGLKNPENTLDDLTREFQDKKVRITIEIIED